MKTIIKEYGKKLLSLVMAVVMTLTLVNLAPFAQEAKAATTLYFHASGDAWSNGAYLWAWNGYTPSADWPGDALTKVEGTNGWWSINIGSDSFWGYVQNANSTAGTDKTFSVSGGGDKYVVFDGNNEIVYSSLAEAEAAAGEALFPPAVTEYPDMVITNVWWEPASPTAGDKVTFHATIKNQGEAATPGDQTNGVAFWIDGQKLNLWSGGSFGAIQPGQSVDVQADGGDITWTATEGSHTLMAMVDDAGRYAESDENNNTKEATINVAAAPTPTNITFTIVDCNGIISPYSPDVRLIDKTTGTTYHMSTTDNTNWTVSIPSSVTNIEIQRWGNTDSTSSTLYQWNAWSCTRPTDKTTYYITGYNSSLNGAADSGNGQWTAPSTEQPTTPAPTGDIYGTPFTETQLWDMSYLELEDVVDANSGAEELFVVPGTLYNYKSGGGSAWWDQFRNLDNQIISTYYGTGKMEYPLLIGAPDTMWDDTDAQGDRALNRLMNYKTNEDITSVEALYYINHNLSTGPHDGWGGIGSGSAVVQGLVAEYLSTEGLLLSAENNVIMPFFDDRFLGTTGDGNVVNGTWATKYGNKDNPLSFPFRVDGSYYVFDSASGKDNIRVENEKIVYDSSSNAKVKNGFASSTGFYPFDTSADSGNADALTYGFGARLDIPFNVVNGKADNVTPTVASKTASIGWNNSSVQTWTVDLGTTLTAGQTYTIVLDSDMGGGITWDYMGIDGQNKYFGDTSWYSVEGDVSYLRVNDINSSSDCLSKIDGKILMTITPSSNISSFTLHGKTYDKNYNLGVNVYSGSKSFDSIVYPPEDIVFNFSGDDDLWVYVDGKLVLDMGGAHGQASGNINFTDGTVTVYDAYAMNYDANRVSGTGVTTTSVDWIKFGDPNVTHTMTVFYMERGLYDSNLKISFNFNPVQLTQRNGLTVSNKVDLSDINNGFLTNLNAYDFDFTYDAYDVTDYNLSGNKDLLFEGGNITITGDGSKTAYLEQEHTDGTGTIRGDEAKVTQSQYPNFDTSYELINTSGNVIHSSTSDNPYNVVDGKVTDGETEDVYFELEDGSGAESNLHIQAAFTNKAKVTSLTLSKLDNSIAHIESDQYTFIVEYTKLLGVAKTGFFSGEYTITDTRNGSTRTSATSNGEITICAYEVVTINGVPVDSEIRISEKNDGNYIKTVVTTSAAAEVEIDNDAFYSITSDANVTYDWQIVNGDKNTAVYFAEVGTPVIINCGDELANIQLSSTTETGEFRYQVEVPADTITVNAPNSNSVTGGADLVITDISWGGTDIAVGDDVVFTVTVKNVGDTDIPANEVIGLDIVVDGNSSNALYCDTYANGIKAGSTVTLTINSDTWKATNGSHTFRANIDDRGKFAEVNESNNYYEMTFTTPYEAGGIEQRVATTTYSYHEEIIAGAVSGTIGTVSHTKDSITYTYPGSESAGEDVFYYEVAQIADSDVVVNGQTIVKAGEVYYTTSTAAKVYSYKLSDDVYVLDYGLPVILSEEPNHLKANDVTSLSGVATTLVDMGYAVSGTALATSKPANGVYVKSNTYANEGNGSFGRATLNNSEYKYSLNKLFDGIETFYYGVQVTAAGATGTLNAANATPIMTSKVTVVPASIVYYEDNFTYSSEKGTTSAITYTGDGVVVNSTGLDITQSNSLNDIYGFDEAYKNEIGDGNGSTLLEKGQTVEFTFKGTGFDIVARTADTATVLYVVSKDNKLVEMGNVDTYYDAGVLYQLPVISVQDLEYGEYKVQFMILSSSAYSEFYFDGIRIYNPLGSAYNIDGIDKTNWTIAAGATDTNLFSTEPDPNDAKQRNQLQKYTDQIDFYLNQAIDGKNDSRWTSYVPQLPGMYVIVDMGDDYSFDTLELVNSNVRIQNEMAGGDLNDRPAAYEIYVASGDQSQNISISDRDWVDKDNISWRKVAEGTENTSDVYELGTQSARYIKIVQTGYKQADLAGLYWSIHEIYVYMNSAEKYYSPNEYGAKVTPIIDMILGDCTFTETGIYDANGNLIPTVPNNSQIAVVGDMITEDLGNSTIKTGSLLADLLSDGPNNEVYLGSGSKLAFYATKTDDVANDADRTLQVEVKAVSNKMTYTDVVIDNRDKWVATASMGTPKNAIDDDLSTRWNTSYQRSETDREWFQVDMAKEYTFDAINLALGTSTNDWPANYEVFVSNDGGEWTSVATGVGESGLETIVTGRTTARYVRVEQWGIRSGNYWSVHEFGLKSIVPIRDTDPTSYPKKDNWSVIDANSDTNVVNRLIDNKTVDRWTSYGNMATATEANPIYFVVDLGTNYDFDTVQMLLGKDTNDQPDNYKISVSTDNASWTVVASGVAAGGTEEYSVGSQNARYVKVEGWGGGNYWSVYEFGIANKSAAVADTGLDLTLNSSKDVIASINTNTAMYYEIPMSLCADQGDSKYLVVINGASADDYNLSFTNLKVKGYKIERYTPETGAIASGVYIKDIAVNNNDNVSFERTTIEKKSEVAFVLTLSETATMNKENLSLTANGKDVTIRSVELKAGTSNEYIVKTLAPNVVGTFTYSFAYTNPDNNVVVSSISANVTAISSGDRPAVPSRPR